MMRLVNNIHLEYIQPLIETIFIASKAMICGSPLDGGLEDTEEDDLIFYIE